MPDLRPTEMSNSFTSDEIKKTVSKMKMSKSPGCDEIPVELIMCAPDFVYESTAEIFNQIASDGDCPKEIKPWNTSTISKTWEINRTSIKP